MKFLNFIFNSILIFILMSFTFSMTTLAIEKSQTDVNVTVIDGKDINKDVLKDGNEYITPTAKELRRLPQTNEVLSAFIVSLLGLSVLLFITVLFINKSYINYLGWKL